MELNQIYNQDCLVGMLDIPDKSIDAIICDLPYGTTRNHWDSAIPLDALWKQYNRIIKDNGAIILFSQMPFTAALACSNLSMLKYEIIWRKNNSTGFLNANFAPLKSHEVILVFSKASACFVKDKRHAMVYNPQKSYGHKPYVNRKKNSTGSKNYDFKHFKSCITRSDGERFPTDVLTFPYDKEKLHPTQKPVALIEYLVKSYTNSGGVVLDNCMGSGSTAIACINTNRNFIGYELDKTYYDIACQRIKQADMCREMDMFNAI